MDVWVSVYVVDGVISDIRVFENKDDALEEFDRAVYDLVENETELFNEYGRYEETGDCYFAEDVSVYRHPVEMIVQRTALRQKEND